MNESAEHDDDFAALLAGEFVARGLSPEHADKLARFVDDASHLRMRAHLRSVLEDIRPTRSGTALLLALNDGEGVRAAAARLRCSPGALSAMVNELKERMGLGKRTRDRLR